MSDHLAVIGGGQAAVQTIQSVRAAGFDGRITLVADEAELPYQRPPLSKHYLAGKFDRERLALRPAGFYQTKAVDLLTGTRATGLEAGRLRVALDDGGTLSCSSVVVATGSRPRRLDVPGSELDGVFYLRSLADADALLPVLGDGARLVIVGGGYIGLEAAAVARGFGVDVTILEAADRVMARVVAPELSQFYLRKHCDAGVAIHCGESVSRFEGTDRVRRVATASGRNFEADAVLVAIGIVPNVELAATAGLDTVNGVLVDEHARTAAAGVLAAGDCTRHRHTLVGREMRLESVHNAISQARSAAGQIAGKAEPFTEVPWFWSDQYDLKLQIAGVAVDHDATVLRGTPEDDGFALVYLRAGIPIAIDCVNRPRDFMGAKKLIAARAPVPVDALRDPAIDLASLATADQSSAIAT